MTLYDELCDECMSEHIAVCMQECVQDYGLVMERMTKAIDREVFNPNEGLVEDIDKEQLFRILGEGFRESDIAFTPVIMRKNINKPRRLVLSPDCFLYRDTRNRTYKVATSPECKHIKQQSLLSVKDVKPYIDSAKTKDKYMIDAEWRFVRAYLNEVVEIAAMFSAATISRGTVQLIKTQGYAKVDGITNTTSSQVVYNSFERPHYVNTTGTKLSLYNTKADGTYEVFGELYCNGAYIDFIDCSGDVIRYNRFVPSLYTNLVKVEILCSILLWCAYRGYNISTDGIYSTAYGRSPAKLTKTKPDGMNIIPQLTALRKKTTKKRSHSHGGQK